MNDLANEKGGKPQIKNFLLFLFLFPFCCCCCCCSFCSFCSCSLPSAMCKHVKNAQVSIRAPCCKMWFDCAECHADAADHPLMKRFEMVFGCKKCKKVFRKDLRCVLPFLYFLFILSPLSNLSPHLDLQTLKRDFDESDQYCPHCDNMYWVEVEEVRPAPTTVAAGAGAQPQVLIAQSDDPEELRRRGFTNITRMH